MCPKTRVEEVFTADLDIRITFNINWQLCDTMSRDVYCFPLEMELMVLKRVVLQRQDMYSK